MIEGERPPLANSTADVDDGQNKRWRSEFPYHWDADDLVTRRELLQFAVYTSGTLFGGTALLALLGAVQQPLRTEPLAVATVNDVPEGQAVYFNYPDPDDQAMLLHLAGGEWVAYSQKCTHLSCAVYYENDNNRLYCPCHEGVFDPATGEPPPGRRSAPCRAACSNGKAIRSWRWEWNYEQRI